MAGTVSRPTAGIVSAVTTDSGPLPGPLRWAAALLRGEATAIGLLAAFLVYQDLTTTAADLVAALVVTAFTAGIAAALWALAVALGRRRAGARAPAIVLQLMFLPVGYYMVQGGLAWLGIPLVVLGVLVCGLLVSPPTTRGLGLG
jgi:hypothetical protein